MPTITDWAVPVSLKRPQSTARLLSGLTKRVVLALPIWEDEQGVRFFHKDLGHCAALSLHAQYRRRRYGLFWVYVERDTGTRVVAELSTEDFNALLAKLRSIHVEQDRRAERTQP